MDPKVKIHGHIAAATLKNPPLPPMPKPTTIELGGKKYSVLLLPMGMEELFEAAQKKGWHDCVRTHFEGYGYHVMTKNVAEVHEIGIQFLGRSLDNILKREPEVSPSAIRRYALALEKIRQPKSAAGNIETANLLKGKEVIVDGKVYEVIAIPYKSYGALAPMAIQAGYKIGVTIPGEGESITNACGKESCHYILVRAESAEEAQRISLEMLNGNYKPKT